MTLFILIAYAPAPCIVSCVSRAEVVYVLRGDGLFWSGTRPRRRGTNGGTLVGSLLPLQRYLIVHVYRDESLQFTGYIQLFYFPATFEIAQIMSSNWPTGYSRPANTVLELVYSNPSVSRRVRDSVMELVRNGMSAGLCCHLSFSFSVGFEASATVKFRSYYYFRGINRLVYVMYM